MIRTMQQADSGCAALIAGISTPSRCGMVRRPGPDAARPGRARSGWPSSAPTAGFSANLIADELLFHRLAAGYYFPHATLQAPGFLPINWDGAPCTAPRTPGSQEERQALQNDMSGWTWMGMLTSHWTHQDTTPCPASASPLPSGTAGHSGFTPQHGFIHWTALCYFPRLSVAN